MDELDLLAGARPVTPPSAQAKADARVRLLALTAAQKPAPRRRRRFGWSLVPAMAAAAAVVVALSTSLHGPAGPGVSLADAGPPPPQQLRVLLLAAADSTVRDSAAGGRFWVSEVESGTLLTVGADGNRYAIMGRTEETSWYTVRRDDRAVSFQQWAGGAPASDADRAAWRRAGSPSSWLIDESCPRTGTYTAGAGPVRTIVAEPQTSTFTMGGEYLTAAQIRDLPTDPVALQAWLVDSLLRGSPDLTAAQLSEGIFNSMINLLYQAPSTPALRAAAYRMLADLPGLHDLGTVTDPKGRTGTAVTLVTNKETAGVRQADSGGAREVRLIFDPQSGQPLAWETRILKPTDYLSWVPAGALFDYQAVLRTRWSDDTPPSTAGALPEDVVEPAPC